MSLNGTAFEKKQKPIPPQGPQIAICYSIVDLGTHLTSFQGQTPKPTALVHFSWELPNLLHVTFKEGEQPKPLAMFQEYSTVLSDRSKLTKMLTAWRQKAPQNLAVELPQFLGQPCMINVEYKRDKQKPEIIYANVAGNGLGIMPLMAGTSVGPLTNRKVLFNLDTYSHEQFLALPTWIQKKIQMCQEWSGIVAKYGPVPVVNNQQQGVPQNTGFQNQQTGFQQQPFSQQPPAQNTGFQTTHTIPAPQQTNQNNPPGVGFGNEMITGNPFDAPPF